MGRDFPMGSPKIADHLSEIRGAAVWNLIAAKGASILAHFKSIRQWPGNGSRNSGSLAAHGAQKEDRLGRRQIGHDISRSLKAKRHLIYMRSDSETSQHRRPFISIRPTLEIAQKPAVPYLTDVDSDGWGRSTRWAQHRYVRNRLSRSADLQPAAAEHKNDGPTDGHTQSGPRGNTRIDPEQELGAAEQTEEGSLPRALKVNFPIAPQLGGINGRRFAKG